jgi:solute carrier family 35, member C2
MQANTQALHAGAQRSWHAYATTVLPNGVATGLDIGFSNASLSIITLSFYTMCKASAPLFLLLCAFIWRIERPTWSLTAVMCTISLGLLMLVAGKVEQDESATPAPAQALGAAADSTANGTADRSAFSFVGFALVMSAAAMSGVRWTITQILLQVR